jgi:hypothetical protein
MASTEYRVTEFADGTFTVELWQTTNLVFKRDGFQNSPGGRSVAQAHRDNRASTSRKGRYEKRRTKSPVVVIDNTAAD